MITEENKKRKVILRLYNKLIPASFTVCISEWSMSSSKPYIQRMLIEVLTEWLKAVRQWRYDSISYLVCLESFNSITSKPINTKWMLKSRMYCSRIYHVCKTCWRYLKKKVVHYEQGIETKNSIFLKASSKWQFLSWGVYQVALNPEACRLLNS